MDPSYLRAQMERGGGPGGAAAAAALLARECQDAKLETEFLRRIEALEAKVGDRDSLLAKLSRQQARLDRLESLARENEILKAHMRGQARLTGDKVPAAGAGGDRGKDSTHGRRQGVHRQASGRLRPHAEEKAPEVRIVTARDEAMGREASMQNPDE